MILFKIYIEISTTIQDKNKELYYKHILLKSGYYYFQFDISINF